MMFHRSDHIHADAVIEAGATREEIAEALGVAIAADAGAALVFAARVVDAYAAKSAASAARPAGRDE